MHLKQEIVSEALNKLASKGTFESSSGSIRVPVTLIAPIYVFYTYLFEFERANYEDGIITWVPKEIIKL